MISTPLGFLLLDHQHYREALIQFASMKSVPPDKASRLFQGFALCYDGFHDRKKALKAAQRACKYAISGEDISYTEALLSFLKNKGRSGPPPVVPGQDVLAELAEDSPPPRLRREDSHPPPPASSATPETPAAVKPNSKTISGEFQFFDCGDKVAIIKMLVKGKSISIAVYDPRNVNVNGTGGASVSLRCGPQKRREITVEYQPMLDDNLGTIGAVRAIDLQ